ncbi:MAG: hypothetical protein ACUVQH_12180, partial [Thermogutta sp.]
SLPRSTTQTARAVPTGVNNLLGKSRGVSRHSANRSATDEGVNQELALQECQSFGKKSVFW